MSDENRSSLSTSETATPPAGDTLQSTRQSQQNADTQGQFTAAVDELLDQLQHKFDTVSREMFGKLDDMARRLDELESSLTIANDTAATTTPSK